MEQLLIKKGFNNIANFDLGIGNPTNIWCINVDEEGDPIGKFIIELPDGKFGGWVITNDPYNSYVDVVIDTEEKLDAFILLFIN